MTTITHAPPTKPTGPDAAARPRRRALGLAALSGLLLVGAYPHLDWGWLAWVGMVPFLATFPHRRRRDALAAGAVFGLTFYGGVWYWMAVFAGHVIGGPLSLVIWLGAAGAQTCTAIAFAAGAQFLSRRGGVWAWRLGVPALWAVGEWARQFGALGTNWSDLAYTQHAALPILQLTKLTGVFGLSFLIVLVNVAARALWRASFGTEEALTLPSPKGLGEGEEKKAPTSPISTLSQTWERVASLSEPGEGHPARFPVAVAGLVGAALLYGTVVLHTERLRPTFAAAALQTDIDQDQKWTPQYVQSALDTYGAQAHAAAARGAQLVVWPETGFPGFLRAQEDAPQRAEAQRMAVQNHEAMLIGSLDYDAGAQKSANSLLMMTADGALTGGYRKQRLVPFGEYVPWRKYLPFMDALHLTIYDMVPGEPDQPLLDAGPPVGPVGAAICYDSTNGEIARRQVARGAGLLVVSTDDTWFGRTAAARQHAAMAAVRAAEDDRYLVRCAATGVSQIIDPTGRVVAEAGLFTRRVVAAPVQARHGLTPYARWGDWFVAVCAAGLLLILLPARHLRNPPSRNPPSQV